MLSPWMGVLSVGDCSPQGPLGDDSRQCWLLYWWGMLLALSAWRSEMQLPCTEKVPNLYGPTRHLLDPTWPPLCSALTPSARPPGAFAQKSPLPQGPLAVLSAHFLTLQVCHQWDP